MAVDHSTKMNLGVDQPPYSLIYAISDISFALQLDNLEKDREIWDQKAKKEFKSSFMKISPFVQLS